MSGMHPSRQFHFVSQRQAPAEPGPSTPRPEGAVRVCGCVGPHLSGRLAKRVAPSKWIGLGAMVPRPGLCGSVPEVTCIALVICCVLLFAAMAAIEFFSARSSGRTNAVDFTQPNPDLPEVVTTRNDR